jgi:hypothetical protein
MINSSCNGIRLIGPAEHLIINDCLFYGPGRFPHRSSNRSNMLAGICLQPGAWDRTRGLLDDVLISDVTMDKVAAPFHFSLRKGNTAGTIQVDRLSASGIYRAASSIESWNDSPWTNIVLRNVSMEFEGGGAPDPKPVKRPGVDVRALPAWAIYLRNVETITLDDVRVSCRKEDARPVMIAEHVGKLITRGFAFPRAAGVSEPLVLTNVASVESLDHR